jgi:hypothetical protein
VGRDNYIHIIKTTPEKVKLFENGEAYIDYWNKELFTQDEVIAQYEQERKADNYEDEYTFETYCCDNYDTYEGIYSGDYISDHKVYPLSENEVLLIIAICS